MYVIQHACMLYVYIMLRVYSGFSVQHIQYVQFTYIGYTVCVWCVKCTTFAIRTVCVQFVRTACVYNNDSTLN